MHNKGTKFRKKRISVEFVMQLLPLLVEEIRAQSQAIFFRISRQHSCVTAGSVPEVGRVVWEKRILKYVIHQLGSETVVPCGTYGVICTLKNPFYTVRKCVDWQNSEFLATGTPTLNNPTLPLLRTDALMLTNPLMTTSRQHYNHTESPSDSKIIITLYTTTKLADFNYL